MLMFFSSAIIASSSFKASLTCDNWTLTVFLTKDEMGGASAEEIHLIGESCLAEDFNSTHFRVSTMFDECGTVAEVRNVI